MNKTLPSSPAAEFPTASLSRSVWLETALPLFVLRRTLNALFIFLKDLLLIVERSKCRAATTGKNKSIQFSSSSLEPQCFCSPWHLMGFNINIRAACTSPLQPESCWYFKVAPTWIWVQSPNLSLTPSNCHLSVCFANHLEKSPVSVVALERITLHQDRINSNSVKNTYKRKKHCPSQAIHVGPKKSWKSLKTLLEKIPTTTTTASKPYSASKATNDCQIFHVKKCKYHVGGIKKSHILTQLGQYKRKVIILSKHVTLFHPAKDIFMSVPALYTSQIL